jgi:hypothetical protein
MKAPSQASRSAVRLLPLSINLPVGPVLVLDRSWCGSWPQCMRKVGRRLSLNRNLVADSLSPRGTRRRKALAWQASGERTGLSRRSLAEAEERGVWLPFAVRMRKPTGCLLSPALSSLLRPEERETSRVTLCDPERFMVPMRFEMNGRLAMNAPPGPRPRSRSRYSKVWFITPMRARKRKSRLFVEGPIRPGLEVRPRNAVKPPPSKELDGPRMIL